MKSYREKTHSSKCLKSAHGRAWGRKGCAIPISSWMQRLYKLSVCTMNLTFRCLSWLKKCNLNEGLRYFGYAFPLPAWITQGLGCCLTHPLSALGHQEGALQSCHSEHPGWKDDQMTTYWPLLTTLKGLAGLSNFPDPSRRADFCCKECFLKNSTQLAFGIKLCWNETCKQQRTGTDG